MWSMWKAVRRINIEILGVQELTWILEPLKNQSPEKVLEICFWIRVPTPTANRVVPSIVFRSTCIEYYFLDIS